jgi:hypothetical protein
VIKHVIGMDTSAPAEHVRPMEEYGVRSAMMAMSQVAKGGTFGLCDGVGKSRQSLPSAVATVYSAFGR